MSSQSDQLVVRSRLFQSLLKKYGGELIPGRYGGDFNGDQLGFVETAENVTLFLGLKVLDGEGGLQLDCESLGSHIQFSMPWLKALVQYLKLNSETVNYAVKIEAARSAGSLIAVVLCMDGSSGEVKVFRVAL